MVTSATNSTMAATTKASPFSTPRSASAKENNSKKVVISKMAPAPKAGWPSLSVPNSCSFHCQFQPL
ncbi:hypothetical protein D3C80_1591040 [compost metagenome]